MDNGIATVKDVKDFFGQLVKVEAKEMTDFWKSLNETDEYRYTDDKGVTTVYSSEKDFYKITVGKLLTAESEVQKLVDAVTSDPELV